MALDHRRRVAVWQSEGLPPVEEYKNDWPPEETERHERELSFRELFLHGTGPRQTHNAIIALLAGHVFPRPTWSLRWRTWLFEFFVQLNRKRQIVPARGNFSLVAEPPAELPAGMASQVAPA